MVVFEGYQPFTGFHQTLVRAHEEHCGCRPTDFAKNEVFRHFPGEIRLVETRELRAANEGCSLNRQPRNLYVATSFGLCASLLRQREFPQNDFIRSPEFSSVQNAINCVTLDSKPSLGGKNFNFGASQYSVLQGIDKQLLDWEARFHAAHQEMLHLRKTISELEEVIVAFQRNSTSTVSHGNPDRTSPLSSCSSESGSSSIEETKRSPLGSIIKKKQVAGQCRMIIADLNDLCDKYHESLACVLGNSFLYGNDSEKKDVSKTVSEILNLVMDSKGYKKGFSDLLLPETHQRLLESMRVPDWVLLYFKIKAKLPDAGWQTLLNLTQLGRSGVIIINSFFYF